MKKLLGAMGVVALFAIAAPMGADAKNMYSDSSNPSNGPGTMHRSMMGHHMMRRPMMRHHMMRHHMHHRHMMRTM